MKINFDAEKHIYALEDGTELFSVTEYIHNWFPEFDMVAMAEKCSKGKNPKYRGRDPEDIIKEWEKKREDAAHKGTNVHNFCEHYLTKDDLPSPEDERERQLFKSAADFMNELTGRHKILDCEKLVFSPSLKLAGTFDLLLEDKETGEIIIADWKTSEEIKTSNYFGKGLSVLSFMDDCNFNHYSLQLNLYQHIIEKEGYYPYFGYRKELYHIKETGVDIYPIEDMQNIIKLMLS